MQIMSWSLHTSFVGTLGSPFETSITISLKLKIEAFLAMKAFNLVSLDPKGIMT